MTFALNARTGLEYLGIKYATRWRDVLEGLDTCSPLACDANCAEQKKGGIRGVSGLVGVPRQVAWVVDDGWEAFAELGWVVRTGGDAFRKTHGGKCLWEVLQVCYPPTRFSEAVPTLIGSMSC